MLRFVIDRFKGRPALGIVAAELADGKVTVTGYDAKSLREIQFLLSKPLILSQVAVSGANALAATTDSQLEPGTEEHFLAVMQVLPDYGFSARRVSQHG